MYHIHCVAYNRTNNLLTLFGLIDFNKNNLFSILGDQWPSHLDQLGNLKKHANDPKFQREFMEAKSQNKRKLAAYLTEKTGMY